MIFGRVGAQIDYGRLDILHLGGKVGLIPKSVIDRCDDVAARRKCRKLRWKVLNADGNARDTILERTAMDEHDQGASFGLRRR